MVLDGSVMRSTQDLGVTFVLTDHQGSEFSVRYTGILPDLFREGQGILVEGQLSDSGVLEATEVLAKHDENYMPPELMELQTADQAQTPKPVMSGYPGSSVAFPLLGRCRCPRHVDHPMIPELGNFALTLAGVLALGAAGIGLAAPREALMQRAAMSMVLGQWAFSFLAFAALTYAYVHDDFSDAYVANQSKT